METQIGAKFLHRSILLNYAVITASMNVFQISFFLKISNCIKNIGEGNVIFEKLENIALAHPYVFAQILERKRKGIPIIF